MSPPLKVLFAEPPPARRVGGIETALMGLEKNLSASGIMVTRSSDLTAAHVADADLVHFHGIWEPQHPAARRWCRAAGKPFVVSPHGMLEPWAFQHRGWKKRPYFRFIERPSIARAKALLATSDDEAKTLHHWFPTQAVRVLPLGTDIPVIPSHAAAREKLGWSSDERIILFLSRLHEKKGLHLLVEALPLATLGGRTPARLVIVGDGAASYIDPLKQKVATGSNRVRVTWLKGTWGAEKWDYFSGADLFCLPSFSENFGLAILESLCAGTPVLTTPHTPWASLRGPLPVRLTAADVPSLAAALQDELAASPPTEAARAATRREAAAMFSWRDLAPRYAGLYRELVQRP